MRVFTVYGFISTKYWLIRKGDPLKVFADGYSPDSICRLCGVNFMQLQMSHIQYLSSNEMLLIIKFVMETTCFYISFL